MSRFLLLLVPLLLLVLVAVLGQQRRELHSGLSLVPTLGKKLGVVASFRRNAASCSTG